MQIDIYPTMAPFVTGEPGPAGELATLRLPHLLVTVAPVSDPDVALVVLAVDGTLGMEASLVAGELTFSITPPLAQDLSLTILENALPVNDAQLQAIVPQLLALLIPSLAGSLGSFPLPDFLGLQMSLVDVDRNGEFISLFLNLAP
jgi:hypothetical protein